MPYWKDDEEEHEEEDLDEADSTKQGEEGRRVAGDGTPPGTKSCKSCDGEMLADSGDEYCANCGLGDHHHMRTKNMTAEVAQGAEKTETEAEDQEEKEDDESIDKERCDEWEVGTEEVETAESRAAAEEMVRAPNWAGMASFLGPWYG